MSQYYPGNLDVTPQAFKAAIDERLGHEGEWTPYQTMLMDLARTNAESIVAAAHRLAWTDDHDHKATRKEIGKMFQAVLSRMKDEHIPDGYDHETGNPRETRINLLVKAHAMVDDMLVALRRGPVSYWPEPIYGGGADGLTEIAGQAVDNHVRELGDGDRAFTKACDAYGDLIEDGSDGIDGAIVKNHELCQKSMENAHRQQTKRTADRIADVVRKANEHFALPSVFALHVTDTRGDLIKLTWGSKPERKDIGAGMVKMEAMTRPFGDISINKDLNSFGEIGPKTLSDLLTAGLHVALIIGRDAEVRAVGGQITDPPAWCRAAFLPVTVLIRTLLETGRDVDLGKNPFSENGALITIADLSLGEGITYQNDGYAMTQAIHVEQTFPLSVMVSSQGMTANRIIGHPILQHPAINIGEMRENDGKTEITLRSPIIRIVDPPEGVEKDPLVAWLAHAREADVGAIYGERVYREVHEREIPKKNASDMLADDGMTLVIENQIRQ